MGLDALEGFGADAADVAQLCKGREGAVLFAVGNDAMGDTFAESRDGGEFFGGCVVEWEWDA